MMAGIDEAGKGPVIGPMVVCGVLCDEESLSHLISLGVKDSKKLSKKRREELYEVIRSLCRVEVVKVDVDELNALMEFKTINEILREAYVDVIRRLKPKVVYVDCPERNVDKFKHYLEERTGVEVIASHKADEIYPIVSVASVVAKVERDREIERLKSVYGDFGSGYPSDKRTIEFLQRYLKEHGKLPPIVRKKWKTLRKISSHSLSDFFEV